MATQELGGWADWRTEQNGRLISRALTTDSRGPRTRREAMPRSGYSTGRSGRREKSLSVEHHHYHHDQEGPSAPVSRSSHTCCHGAAPALAPVVQQPAPIIEVQAVRRQPQMAPQPQPQMMGPPEVVYVPEPYGYGAEPYGYAPDPYGYGADPYAYHGAPSYGPEPMMYGPPMGPAYGPPMGPAYGPPMGPAYGPPMGPAYGPPMGPAYGGGHGGGYGGHTFF